MDIFTIDTVNAGRRGVCTGVAGTEAVAAAGAVAGGGAGPWTIVAAGTEADLDGC